MFEQIKQRWIILLSHAKWSSSDQIFIEVFWWWHNMIKFIFQTLVEFFRLILNMLEDEHAYFITRPFSITKRGFILANAMTKNNKYKDFSLYTLTASKGILLQFTFSPHDFEHFSTIQNSFTRLTASAWVD